MGLIWNRHVFLLARKDRLWKEYRDWHLDSRMDGWMMDGWTDGRADGQADRWISRRMAGEWANSQARRQTKSSSNLQTARTVGDAETAARQHTPVPRNPLCCP